MQGVKRYKVSLLPHDDNWEQEFLKVKTKIYEIWNNNILDIQHIGSTAIKNIWAKPILDVAVVLKSFKDMDAEALTDIGYDYCGLQKPDNGRYLFVLRGEEEISLHHIHCYEANNQDYINCLNFRDYLNCHLDKAIEYSNLKRIASEKYPNDRNAYANAKQPFIDSVYALFSNKKQEN